MKTQRFLAFWLFLVGLLLGSSNAYAQWPGGGGTADNLVLVSSTDFSVAGGEDSFYHSTDLITGFDGIVKPHIFIGDGYTTPKSCATEYGNKTLGHKSSFSDFLEGKHYAVTNNAVRLDSFRMNDYGKAGQWGIVFSTDKGVTGPPIQKLMTYSVRGLKNNGNYRVEVEVCNPLGDDYLTNQSDVNKMSEAMKGPTCSSYNVGLKVGTNNNLINPGGKDVQPGQKPGGCVTVSIPYMANQQDYGPIANEKLDVNFYLSQGGANCAVMIKSIKVYAELDPKIMGKTSECVGGKTATFKLNNTFMNCTYQWYKNATAIPGATGSSYTHETGNVEDAEFDYYVVVTTPSGDKVKSNTIHFVDVHCCSDPKTGQPMDEKLIWQDDFGTFTKKGTYWVWDYTDINNPVKVEKKAPDGWTYELPYDIPGASYLSTVYGEGTYSVAANVTCTWDGATTGTVWEWQAYTFYGDSPKTYGETFAPDHTYNGSDYGAMLFLNCGNEPDAVIYDKEIEGLCEKDVKVKCFVSNWSRSTNPVKIKIKVTDMISGLSQTSSTIERYAEQTGATSYNSETAWEEVSIPITLTGASPKLRFEIISVGGGAPYNKDGNDLLLDDIQVWTCTPPSVKLFFDEDWTIEDTSSCIGDDIKLYVEESTMITSFYKGNGRYVYQYSLEDPSKLNNKSWKPVPGSSITKDPILLNVKDVFEGLNPDDKVYFRVVLGSEETMNTLGLNHEFNPNEACASYTVSDPIEVTVKCDACTEPLDKIKIKADKTAITKKNKKDVIELCYGESVTLSQAADITPDKADWASADFEGFAIKWFEAEKPGDMLGAKSVLKGTISPKVVNYDDESLGGTEMPVVLFAVDALYLDGKCKTGDTVYIKFNEKPDAEFSKPKTKFCEGEGAGLVDMRLTKGDLSDYTVRWWQGADTTTNPLGDDKKEEFFETLTADKGGVFSYQLVDNKTGCKGDVHEYEVIVNPIPDAPENEKIQYTINGNSNETMTTDKFSQTIDKSMDLVWFQSKTEPNSQGTKSVQIDRSVPTTTPYVFYIAYRDPNGGCYSERAEVIVEVLKAPTPSVKDIDLCKDGTYDAMEGISATDQGYELIWFKSPTDTAGKALSSAPTDVVDVTTPGQYTLYVAQRATTAPYAQSEVVSFKVTVYDVKAPVDASRHEYCANEPAEELKANLEKDEASYYYADEIVFVSGVDEQPTFIPDTKKSTSQKYEYKAYQKFTTPKSNRVCKGPSIDIQVDVIAVEKPKVNHSVSYVKSEAASTKEFVDILDKSPDVIDIVSGQTLLWSKDENGSFVKGSTSSSKPYYDELVPVGQVEKQERWVKWEATTAAGLTCTSEPEKIDITISSTPAPIVKKIEICEEVFKSGSIPSDKEPADNAKVNDNDKKLPDYEKYELVWFDNQADADESMTDPSKLSLGSKTAPTLADAFTGVDMDDVTVSEWTKSLYVVQSYDDGAGNVTTSPASEMKLIVNATPKLTEKAHIPVCKGPVNLTDNEYWNVSNGVKVEAEYSFEGSSVTQNASGLTKAGKYTIVGTSSLGCKSEELELQLDIRNLSIEMDPRSETCPGGNVEQEVRIDFSYNKEGKEAKDNKVKLSWKSEENTSDKSTQSGVVPGPDETVFTYISGNFEGKAGDTHTITVTMTDGYCIAVAKQTVEIGNGPAGGTFTWMETDNESTENGSKIPLTDSNKDNIEINACGGPVTVDFGNVTRDKDKDVEWFKTNDYTSAYKTGEAPTFSYNDYGTYYVRYTNNCYAYAKVTIKDASVKISTMTDEPTAKCEDDEYKREIVAVGPAGMTRQWYKDGDFYANNSDELSFSPLKKKDQGFYKVEYRYDGCRAELDVVDLKVMEYVKVDVDDYEMYEGKKSFIRTAGDDAKVNFVFTVPSDQDDVKALTATLEDKASRNLGTLNGNNTSFEVTAVDEDHPVKVEFVSDDYCAGNVEFQVLRDAKLVLKADLETKMCLNEEKLFTIDTIGTGAFRRPGAKLEITATPENGTATQEKGFSVTADKLLVKNVSPRVTTTYVVTFTYGNQELKDSITVVVYNFKVEPVNQIICSGEEVALKATVTPKDSKIEWFDDDKTTSLGEGDGILVSPVFDGPVSAAKSQHKYWARPYSDDVTCTSSGMTPLLVDVYRPLEGDIEDKTICEGDNVRIDAGSYGATTYTWTVNGETIKGSRYYQDTPTETTKYQVHMTRGNVCEADDEATVTVTTKPVIASIDSVGYRDVDIVMDPMFGTPAFRYSIDGGEWTEDTHLTGLKYTVHTITVQDANGCVLNDTFVVKDPALEFPIWFSPNKDGEFENWTVPGIQKTYPEAEFTIYDRWGKKLVEFKGEDEGWDGTYNGVAMPSTDYWYECLIREIDKVYKGHFTLIRR